MAAAPTSDDFSIRSGHTNIAPRVCAAFEREREGSLFVLIPSFFLHRSGEIFIFYF